MFKVNLQLISSLALFGFLSACSSSIPEPNYDEEETQKVTFEQHLQEWEEVKPQIDELISLKGELKELISELNTLAELTDKSINIPNNEITLVTPEKKPEPINTVTPSLSSVSKVEKAVIPTPKKIAEVQSEPKAIEATKSVDKTEKQQSNVAIQLASLSNPQALNILRINLQMKFKERFKDKEFITEKATLANQKTINRLKLVNFDNKEEAISLCNFLKTTNQACIVTTY